MQLTVANCRHRYSLSYTAQYTGFEFRGVWNKALCKPCFQAPIDDRVSGRVNACLIDVFHHSTFCWKHTSIRTKCRNQRSKKHLLAQFDNVHAYIYNINTRKRHARYSRCTFTPTCCCQKMLKLFQLSSISSAVFLHSFSCCYYTALYSVIIMHKTALARNNSESNINLIIRTK